mgnify:CR=1 FL=1
MSTCSSNRTGTIDCQILSKGGEVLGRTGMFWQPEYYDHLIRDEADYAQTVAYVVNNPVKAKLAAWRWVGRGMGGSP